LFNLSYDLTIRSNETFSRSTSRAALESFVKQLPGVKPNGRQGFALDARPKRWMEIDFEVVNAEGDNIESNQTVSTDINCVRLHIPSKYLGEDIEHDYLPTAFAIAEHVGWTLYDDQDDEPVSKVDREAVKANAPPVFDRKILIGEWLSFPHPWGNAYMNYRLAEDGRFEATMIDDGGSLCLNAKGNWELVGDAIQWSYDSCKGAPRPRKPELNKILHADENGFALRENSGGETKFTRPAPSNKVLATFTHTELRPFFQRLIGLIDAGFAAQEIDGVMKTAGALGEVKSQDRVFKITFRGVVSPFHIRLSIGENGSFGTAFSGPVALVEEIAALIKTA
jgi:hypothetical protein